MKQFRLPLDNLLHSFPVDTGDVYVVTAFGEETTEGGHVMAVPSNCVFGENVAHSTFIVIFVVRAAVIAAVVTPKWVVISVTIAIVTIVISVAGVQGRIRILRISVGSVWVVAPVPVPPRTPPPWKAEDADKDDFFEMVEVMKSIEVAAIETVEATNEGGVKAPRIPIRDIELPCPLICAVAIEAAKTHATTQPRRTNFLQFIAL